ncbi:MAG: response regulator [Acetobacterales bacterium]
MVQALRENDLSNIAVLLVGPASIARFAPILQKRALRYFEAQDAAAALGNLYRWQPGAIVCDHDMPNITGTEFTRIVRHAPNIPDPTVPLMLFVGDADRAVVEEARDAGVGQIVVLSAGEATLWAKLRQAITSPPRFVAGAPYFGPDRRYLNRHVSPERRRTPATLIARPCGAGRVGAF